VGTNERKEQKLNVPLQFSSRIYHQFGNVVATSVLLFFSDLLGLALFCLVLTKNRVIRAHRRRAQVNTVYSSDDISLDSLILLRAYGSG
jgi:hypothetical protein